MLANSTMRARDVNYAALWRQKKMLELKCEDGIQHCESKFTMARPSMWPTEAEVLEPLAADQ
jgi:hypothetical protein